MNINPHAKRVLVFGDSNTYGSNPDKLGRFNINERYTGVLQSLLGNEYEIIEEGLSARTICASDQDSIKKGVVGIDYLLPCFVSHSPIDILIINLGSNEFKEKFDLSAEKIRDNLAHLCNSVLERNEKLKEKNRYSNLKIIIVAPRTIDEHLVGEGWKGSGVLSRETTGLFKQYSRDRNFGFVDLSSVTEVGKDGLHYTLESHSRIAAVLADKIRDLE